MERFYLITNRAKDPDLTVTDQIRQYLEERGKTCLLCDNSEKGEKYHYTDPAKVPSDIDGILVLGGDGTLLQAAGDVVDLQIPLLGINLGTLGYLAEIDRDTLYPALDHLMADEYTIEHRMMLCGSIYRDGKLIAEDAALNDITITREGNLRVVRFDNYVNGEFLNSYSADGIIIATPTGSTGYSLSAGGPIISPSASLMLMTPLAPHTLNTRSIVFPAEDVIEVELGPSRDGGIEQGMAYFDGDTRVPMKTGDRIVIKKARRDTLIVKISNIKMKIRIALPENLKRYDKYEIVYISNGEIKETISAAVENGYIVFETNHLSQYGIIATNTGNGTKSPQTGDNSNLALWFAVLFISGGVLTVFSIASKKKRVGINK